MAPENSIAMLCIGTGVFTLVGIDKTGSTCLSTNTAIGLTAPTCLISENQFLLAVVATESGNILNAL